MAASDGLGIERHYAEWYAVHQCVPSIEVHVDPTLTWMRLPVTGWSNGGVGLAFPPENARRVLGEVAAQFKNTGVGFWVGPDAPATTEPALRDLGFRCRKRFPAMMCDVASTSTFAPGHIEIDPIADFDSFGPTRPHPYVGPVTTAIRRFEIARRKALVAANREVVELGATAERKLVGACIVFVGSNGLASLHDVAVLESERGRGIGRALVGAAVDHARDRGCSRIALISTAMGESVYRRSGFEEVARIGYWYRGRGF
jgi:GNAT superfamily N-acetyltransferase